MGLNNTSAKTAKINQKLPKRELKQIQTQKLEIKDLKKQIKALHKFIKRIKSSSSTRSILPKQVEEVSQEDLCPECDGLVTTLSLPRLDGVFKRVSCLSCDWKTSFTINE